MNIGYVAYYRVSTQKQGKTGLGIEAQKTLVKSFVGCGFILQEFTEIESGKNNNRKKLYDAINYTKAYNAKLIIAKLDRLSRSVSFIFALRDSGVDFICADMPDANTLTIGIFATLAQYERELISERTKKALAEKKKQGIKLGCPDNLTDEDRKKGLLIRKANARNNTRNKQATELIILYRAKGLSLQQIANKLNENGFVTRRNKKFHKSTVKMLLDRV